VQGKGEETFGTRQAHLSPLG